VRVAWLPGAGLALAGCLSATPPAPVDDDALPQGCGDGQPDDGEVCDDGDDDDGDRCARCQAARCGDGFVHRGVEQCDGEATCTSGCVRCEGGDAQYHAAGGSCFLRQDAAGDFDAAGEGCAAVGAYLAEFDDEEEQQEVVTPLVPMTGRTWIGLRYRFGAWEWGIREGLTYASWAPGEPTLMEGGSTAVAIDRDAAWWSAPFAEGHARLCRRDGDGWAVDPATGRAYRVFTLNLTWFAANARCAEDGGHLATIASEAENTAVQAVAGDDLVDTDGVWIGASDRSIEGTFEWVTGEPFATDAWASGEPNDTAGGVAGADCVRLRFGAWEDTACDGTRGFLCEID
jgi:hypothetical protein